MKEPLKDKMIAQPTDFTSIEPIFLVKDVKSAVEWLKDALKNHIIWKSGYNEELVNDMINQAFPDLPPNSSSNNKESLEEHDKHCKICKVLNARSSKKKEIVIDGLVYNKNPLVNNSAISKKEKKE